MTGEYEKPEIIPLSVYIGTLISHQQELRTTQIEGLEELMAAQLESLALAVTKQEQAYNLRFEGVNEWRQTYADLVTKAVTVEIFNSKVGEFERRLSEIERKQANSDGRVIGWSAGVGFVVLIISIVIQFVGK